LVWGADIHCPGSPRRVSLTELADKLEHVLLRPDLTPGEVDDACARAVESGLAAVTVWTAEAARAVAASEGSQVAVVAVLGAPPVPPGAPRAPAGTFESTWPLGASPASPDDSELVRPLDLDELRTAVSAGAGHVAVVLAPGSSLGEDGSALASELETLCRLAHADGIHVRAVLQAHLLDDQQLGAIARLVVEAGADLVQTGFGTQAAATTDQVATIRRALPTRRVPIGVVAGGAIDASAVSDLLEHAGADRVAVLDPAAVLRGVAA
jgi:deoxyribose-phosphate aldolase